jgi:ribosome-interacting GTPase 1
MPVNASPEFAHAEIRFDRATSDEEKLSALEEMMSTMPGHKGAESLRSQLRARYKKLKEKMETKGKKSGGGGKVTIKKEAMQAAIVGFPNTGKSFLFKVLTNQKSNISDVPFSTYAATPGMMQHEDVQIQIIDMPPFPNEDKSIINTADTILITIDNLQQIEESKQFFQRAIGKKIYIYTKTDLLNEAEKRRLEATLKSKYRNIDWVIFSNLSHEKTELEHLKKKIFETFPIIRVYTKEPKKQSTGIPMILEKDSRAKDVAEKIIKGMSKKIKKTKIWGPSSKFPGQMIGLDHALKDKDTIEFQTE